MSDQETEMEWFGDDEPKKPTGGDTTRPSKQKSSSSTTYSQANTMGNDGYKVVHRDTGEAKGASGEIIIETAIKGLLYRCEVFKSGSLIDAREINCKDLLSNAEKDYIFKQRYMATHNTFKMQYIAEEFFKEFDLKEGTCKDKDDDGEEQHCKVVTSFSDDTIRTIIYVEGEEFETKEIAIKDNLKNKKNLVEKKCREFHLENVEKYLDTWPPKWIPKWFPCRKKRSLFFLCAFLSVILTLFIIKLVYCVYLGSQPDGKLAKGQFAEKICHTLENRCLESKDSGWAKGVKPTQKQCMGYRYKTHIFSKEVYDKIFSSSDSEKLAKECKAGADNDWNNAQELKETCLPLCKENVISPENCQKSVAHYTIVPKELTLSLDDSQPIYLSNKSSDTLIIKIVDIQMDDSSKTEDIVYIVGLERTRTLESGESDEFRIRLEHSATQYFDANVEYTGTIKLIVLYDGKEKHESVRFKFTLDI